MKNTWAKVSYWWFVFMLFIIGLFSGDLFVKADTFSTKEARWFYDVQGTESATSWQTIPYTQNFNWPVTQGQYRLKISNGWSAGSSYKFKISYLPGTDSVNPVDIWFSDIDNNRAEKTCTGWVRESNGYRATTCVIEPAFDISSSNYMYVRIVFAGGGGYVGSMRSWVGEYQMSLGTAGAINNQTIIINNELQEQTDVMNDINDNITSDDVDDPSDTFDELNDMLPQNGVITQLITLPITLYQKVLTSLSGTCQSFDLGTLYNHNLIMPCINPGQYLGNTLWGIIDTILSGMLVWHIAKTMIKAFNNFTSLKEGDVVD